MAESVVRATQYLQAQKKSRREWQLLNRVIECSEFGEGAAAMTSNPADAALGRRFGQKLVPPGPQQRKGCGCLSSIGGMILFVLALTVLLNPWALHIGGRPTPALTWHGVGKLHSSTGASYGIFLEVGAHLSHGRGGSNLSGTAKLCTPHGEIVPLTVEGYLKRAWFDTDGKAVTFYFRSPKDAQNKIRFDLYGAWQGQQLALDDQGSMAMSFAADGSAKGYRNGQNAPKESATGTLSYATAGEFATVCSDKEKNSF